MKEQIVPVISFRAVKYVELGRKCEIYVELIN